MLSSVRDLGRVPFPQFSGERVYMRRFTRSQGLPADLRRWQQTVDAMLEGVDAPGPIYLMIDQQVVRAGTSHRRPGVHVDGCWMADGSGHRHTGFDQLGSEGLILASDLLGCRAYVGEIDAAARAGGDCAHLDLEGLDAVDLSPGRAWAGDAASLLHESIPLQRDTPRTVVRLNVPGWCV